MALRGYAQAAAIGRTGIATLTQVPTLNAHGALLGLHDTYRAATMVDPAPAPNGNGDNHMDDYLRKRMLVRYHPDNDTACEP
jgi:hypothetical protein